MSLVRKIIARFSKTSKKHNENLPERQEQEVVDDKEEKGTPNNKPTTTKTPLDEQKEDTTTDVEKKEEPADLLPESNGDQKEDHLKTEGLEEGRVENLEDENLILEDVDEEEDEEQKVVDEGEEDIIEEQQQQVEEDYGKVLGDTAYIHLCGGVLEAISSLNLCWGVCELCLSHPGEPGYRCKRCRLSLCEDCLFSSTKSETKKNGGQVLVEQRNNLESLIDGTKDVSAQVAFMMLGMASTHQFKEQLNSEETFLVTEERTLDSILSLFKAIPTNAMVDDINTLSSLAIKANGISESDIGIASYRWDIQNGKSKNIQQVLGRAYMLGLKYLLVDAISIDQEDPEKMSSMFWFNKLYSKLIIVYPTQEENGLISESLISRLWCVAEIIQASVNPKMLIDECNYKTGAAPGLGNLCNTILKTGGFEERTIHYNQLVKGNFLDPFNIDPQLFHLCCVKRLLRLAVLGIRKNEFPATVPSDMIILSMMIRWGWVPDGLRAAIAQIKDLLLITLISMAILDVSIQGKRGGGELIDEFESIMIDVTHGQYDIRDAEVVYFFKLPGPFVLGVHRPVGVSTQISGETRFYARFMALTTGNIVDLRLNPNNFQGFLELLSVKMISDFKNQYMGLMNPRLGMEDFQMRRIWANEFAQSGLLRAMKGPYGIYKTYFISTKIIRELCLKTPGVTDNDIIEDGKMKILVALRYELCYRTVPDRLLEEGEENLTKHITYVTDVEYDKYA